MLILFCRLIIGVVGRIGIEYNFDFPLQLALDYRPVIGPAWNGVGMSFNEEGLVRSTLGLSLRYLFKQEKSSIKTAILSE